ncbi:diguanylate cyclase [Lachnospira eligens]|uniref:GGDEF domain-containing protein n=1 Tax=Lachnospira eligens (strain ATCC 27750 / DSM 3376 / VPI C15-48 / C15-B4) TaxID=515620 RepID=C4Z1U5_LACE2|nr:histidine kinase N-terminal 7TM domain-containing protein [Lachnospira eligens]ACR72456.1 Hypothetical protein EUBELI_01463 [[Eubacterium] eligens ATCC 27750]UEA98478.1 diguanylate cyclase [Lachnospira eligens]
MNMVYLLLYVIAAMIVGFVMVKTYQEKDRMRRYVIVLLALAMICIVSYSVNFMTDNYNVMSAATSIMMAAQDFLLVSLFIYTTEFARISNKVTKVMTIAAFVIAIIDSVVFIANIFNEIAVKYSLVKCDGIYVLGYEGELWFGIHAVMSMIITACIIAVLVIKCIHIPGAYWGRYIVMAAGLAIIILIKCVFIYKIIDLRFDISIFLYAFIGVMVYWNTFWYSKKNMLTITHAMIIDHMHVPVILFDYEGVLADFNTSMKELFGNLEYDDREQTIDWFFKSKCVPVMAGQNTFQWKLDNKAYDCRIEKLLDDKKRLLGTIIVMQDVTELKRAYTELENMVIYDRLTGVYSMYSFMEHCKSYDGYKGNIAVAVCDIDGLSEINFKYGQKAGNSVLVNVAGVLKKKLKDSAYIARLNEGDFVAVIKNISLKKADIIFAEIEKAVSTECSDDKMKVSMKYGIAMRNSTNGWMMDVVHEAVGRMKGKKDR